MSLQACAETVKAGDADRFLAAMSVPPEARAVLFPLYALNVELSRGAWGTSEPMIAAIRLTWWREALEEIEKGKVRQHEVVQPLAELMGRTPITAALLTPLVEARMTEANREPMESRAALEAHLDATAGTLAWASALGMGARPEQEAPVRLAARAGGLANWFLAVPALRAAGMEPLPEPPGIVAPVGLEWLARARQADLSGVAPALRAHWQARAILTRATKAPERVEEGRLEGSPFAKRLSLIAKSASGGW
ncbi:squalene/phytoene synthase family protein [Pseudoroseicyclus tamaricis]|uniref:Squalene/phytoene synthase family protein n=1 Tax=Pseudoroseicyclus tamaricis TaxID=2705421 RepID=A0A6B2K2U2_9RHOB|nr:squalene/phytoene synthase family protein [Pseudoroseicyclus tamaricis]NDV00796.1 squalene/phytoene synthase family protein [Pseudoroseicyclus tamaricis]